jgi:hypothetical protein
MKLKLEKEMYSEAKSRGISFTELMHRMDNGAGDVEPDAFLKRAIAKLHNTPIDEKLSVGLDAFELQLQEHGIKVSGKEISLVEDFYKTASSASVLFPEYVNRQVRIGMEMGVNECQLSDLVAVSQDIDSGVYQTYAASLDSGKAGGFRVTEGGEFPTTEITTAEGTIRLIKVGHKFAATYEAIRRMRLNLLNVHLRVIGARLARNMVEFALYVLVNGDGNSNSAAVYDQPTLDYDDMVAFLQEFNLFTPNVWVGDKATTTAILQLSEFKDPMAGFNYQKTGDMITPMGMKLRRSDAVTALSIIALDSNSALEQISERGSQLVEADKIIAKQFEEVVISESTGFAKIFTDASQVWDYTND